jgi:hypothetical protein
MARARTGSSGGRRAPAGTPNGGAGFGNAVGAALKFKIRRLDTYRGATTTEWGDIDDTGTPFLVGVQASIAEDQDQVFDQATQRPQVIRSIRAIVPGWADIQETDTIRDPVTGYWYLIESVKQLPGPGFRPPEKELSLKMRSGVDVGSDQPQPGQDGG